MRIEALRATVAKKEAKDSTLLTGEGQTREIPEDWECPVVSVIEEKNNHTQS